MGNHDVGRAGEEYIAALLQARGDVILERNWRVRSGEIDIVSLDVNGELHFIEVKTRRSYAYGHPLEAIDKKKAQRLQRLALAWLATHSALGATFHIDVAAVLIARDGSITHEFRMDVL